MRAALWNLLMHSSALQSKSGMEKEHHNQNVRVEDVVCDPRIGRAHVDNGIAVARRHAHDNHVARDNVGARVWAQALSALHEYTKARHFLAMLKANSEIVNPSLVGSVGEVGFNERVS